MLVLSAGGALAHGDVVDDHIAADTDELILPPGLEVINENNQQIALEFMQNISIPLIFLAGVLSILSPCILPLIPAFFSYTFKEKRKITKMSLVFFLGFSVVFVSMGIAAAYLGQSIAVLQGSMTYIVAIAGLFLIIFGLLAFFGKGFSSIIKRGAKTSADGSGVFLMGIFFAVGWTACLGPIIAGILLIVAAFGNVTYAAIMLFVYSLGIMAPMLIISVFYDRFNIGNSKWVKGREIRFSVLGRAMITHTTEMISGILLVGMGLIFILFGSTSIINTLSPIGSSLLFNDMQALLMNSPLISGIIGFVVLTFVVVGIVLVIFRRNKPKQMGFGLKTE
jgi:cytochrome c-type biogenesis protein